LGFLKNYRQKSVKYTICTDVAKDGLLQGPAVDLYREILQEIPDLCLIASGGVSSVDDLKALQEIQVYGVIIGKAIYEGKITLAALQPFL
jgi:phosphoribosylformimino-5-aminoimidazole carboxamide ribotide isomerase